MQAASRKSGVSEPEPRHHGDAHRQRPAASQLSGIDGTPAAGEA